MAGKITWNEKRVYIYEEWEGGGKRRPECDGKQTNKKNKQKGFEGGWLPCPTVCHWLKQSRSVVCNWADAMGAFGPLMMGVVRRHLAILACPYCRASVWPARWPKCVFGCQLSDSKPPPSEKEPQPGNCWEEKKKAEKSPLFLSPGR